MVFGFRRLVAGAPSLSRAIMNFTSTNDHVMVMLLLFASSQPTIHARVCPEKDKVCLRERSRLINRCRQQSNRQRSCWSPSLKKILKNRNETRKLGVATVFPVESSDLVATPTTHTRVANHTSALFAEPSTEQALGTNMYPNNTVDPREFSSITSVRSPSPTAPYIDFRSLDSEERISLAHLTFSHSDYSDIWPVTWEAQALHLRDLTKDLKFIFYMCLDRHDNRVPAWQTQIFFDDAVDWVSKTLQCFLQVPQSYVLWVMEDWIPVDSPNAVAIKKAIDIIESTTDIGYLSLSPGIFFSNSAQLSQWNQFMYAPHIGIQPALWKVGTAVDVMEKIISHIPKEVLRDSCNRPRCWEGVVNSYSKQAYIGNVSFVSNTVIYGNTRGLIFREGYIECIGRQTQRLWSPVYPWMHGIDRGKFWSNMFPELCLKLKEHNVPLSRGETTCFKHEHDPARGKCMLQTCGGCPGSVSSCAQRTPAELRKLLSTRRMCASFLGGVHEVIITETRSQMGIIAFGYNSTSNAHASGMSYRPCTCSLKSSSKNNIFQASGCKATHNETHKVWKCPRPR
mmetsp:Transcript_29117/g.55952  ORF Transcript_29117/g.55952 Transcript_29117/m.55952 type:complete len:567 (+) Transcript_29117:203-1903(+)